MIGWIVLLYEVFIIEKRERENDLQCYLIFIIKVYGFV